MAEAILASQSRLTDFMDKFFHRVGKSINPNPMGGSIFRLDAGIKGAVAL